MCPLPGGLCCGEYSQFFLRTEPEEQQLIEFNLFASAGSHRAERVSFRVKMQIANIADPQRMRIVQK